MAAIYGKPTGGSPQQCRLLANILRTLKLSLVRTPHKARIETDLNGQCGRLSCLIENSCQIPGDYEYIESGEKRCCARSSRFLTEYRPLFDGTAKVLHGGYG